MSKKDNKLRLCVDYHDLNVIIIKNRHFLSLIFKTLNRLCESKIFTKLNLKMFIINFALRSMMNEKRRFEFIMIISNI